ncbi:phosphatidylinositol/phosphatidylcholine transfer protein SFH13-like isoform X1 [Coffea arabica]|uniref:Phosphatidylinositol/phosphatidylcholine transfer protein SFH13-like isoform X1 n=1 Tax=Coffea arabica TaxID=13443 RepID=A0ABM4WVR7_COFAR
MFSLFLLNLFVSQCAVNTRGLLQWNKLLFSWYERRICSATTILDVQGLGVKKFSRTTANLLASMTKINNNYYPETLHRMFIVNAGPGFKKVLWPAAQKFLDAKTIAKIQVLEPKSLGKLLEAIDSSQLPDFLGGLCSCPVEGGCLSSNMSPWNDPDIRKLVYNVETKFVRQITRVSGDDQKVDLYIQTFPLKFFLCFRGITCSALFSPV